MKFLLFVGALFVCNFASAQGQGAKISDSEILVQCKHLKHDLEDKAITLKSLPSANKADLEEIKESYNFVSKSFDNFISTLENKIKESELTGTRMVVGDFDRTSLQEFLTLYKQYEDAFIQKYEVMVGFSPNPGLPADLDERVASCTLSPSQRCRMIIASNDVKTYIATSARTEKWANL